MRKGDRITSRHILATLEQFKGKAMRFSDIKREMMAKGWIHTDAAILNNFDALIKEGKLVKIYRGLYGIPAVRADGSTYLKMWNSDSDTIELGKVKQNAEP